MKEKTFQEVVRSHEKRIYYFIHHLGIRDEEGEFYQEGLIALWRAWKTHEEGKSPFGTYANWKIRNAMIDRVRKRKRDAEIEERYIQEKASDECYVLPDESMDPILWEGIRAQLTDNQWKWVFFHIVKRKTVAEVAAQEGVTQDAVKNWGRHARRILKTFAPLVDER